MISMRLRAPGQPKPVGLEMGRVDPVSLGINNPLALMAHGEMRSCRHAICLSISQNKSLNSGLSQAHES